MYKTLEKCINASGLKRSYIAKELGITYVNLYQKLNGKSEFTYGQAMKLKSVLRVSDSDWHQIEQEIRK